MIALQEEIIMNQVPPAAREALLSAIDEDWSLSELEPLLYWRYELEDESAKTVRSTMFSNANNNNISISSAERMHTILSNAGIETLLDLVEKTPRQLCKLHQISSVSANEILWALQHFHYYPKIKPLFMQSLWPGFTIALTPGQMPNQEKTPKIPDKEELPSF